MTIFDRKNPVMLISVITYFFKKYIFAIELNKINSKNINNYEEAIVWRNKTTDFGINYAGGQFTILTKNNNPDDNRILFGMYWDGVRAIGSVE